MSLKPEIIKMDQLPEQIHALQQQRDHLANLTKQVSNRIAQLETSLAENDNLKRKIHELIQSSVHLFYSEWKRKDEFYPEIRLGILQKAADLFAAASPAPKK